jgi:predicted metalloprotease with PDZ domain
MSRSSPGRYALHEFAKNVYNVRITDPAGTPLEVTRPDPYGWTVPAHGDTVVVAYTLFGDRVDGTYAAVDLTHAHLNMPATFMWARGLEQQPISITFRLDRPDRLDRLQWRVATQLAPTDDSLRFTAPHLQYFLDSPTELSDFDLQSWTVTSGGRTQTIRFALHYTGTVAERDSFVARVKKVVDAHAKMWGELPTYDYGTYTFIADYLPWANGDGMEHRNSTILTSGSSLARNPGGLLGTVSHEFFHQWNVERIRPATLEPFDFERANMSDALWLAEGFTSYYDDLLIHRAGLTTVEEYARSLAGNVDFVLNAPGRRYFSPIDMSRQAPFVDAATSVDPDNRGNTFISYYTYGAVLGLALDLEIRGRFPGKSLDDFMRLMKRKYGAPEVAYTLDDVRSTLGEAVGDPTWANGWWQQYVDGSGAPPLKELLATVGFTLRKANPGKAWLGPIGFQERDTTLMVASTVTVGSPLYDAGVERGDQLVSLDGRRTITEADVEAVLSGTRPGATIPAVIIGRTGQRRVSLTLQEDFRLEIVAEATTPLRDAWLQ